MKVILKEDVVSLGIEGNVIEVADGYARNYLIPKGLAVPAIEGNLKDLEFRRNAIKKKEAKRVSEAKEHAKKFDGKKLRILVKVTEEGKLYGSVSLNDVTDLIKEKFKKEVDKRIIVLHDHIKETGTYPLHIRLHPEVEATITLEVASEEDPKAKVPTIEEREAKEKEDKKREKKEKRKEEAAKKEAVDDKEAAPTGKEEKEEVEPTDKQGKEEKKDKKEKGKEKKQKEPKDKDKDKEEKPKKEKKASK